MFDSALLDSASGSAFGALKYFVGPSGGLHYHTSATLYRKTLWRPFLSHVSDWLRQVWLPCTDSIVLFGCSAGWSLDFAALTRYNRIICVEPDPLGRALFKRRILKQSRALPISEEQTSRQWPVELSFHSQPEILPWFDSSPKCENFAKFLAKEKSSAFLFTNLLGQIPHLNQLRHEDSKMVEINNRFLEALEGREWASYHDILSAKSAPRISEFSKLERASDLASHLALESLASDVFPSGSVLNDHSTLWLSRGRKTRFAHWQIRPHSHHLIGFVHS